MKTGRVALAYQRRAAVLLTELTEKHPAVLQYKASLASATSILGRLLDRARQWPEAAAAHRQGIQRSSKSCSKAAATSVSNGN